MAGGERRRESKGEEIWEWVEGGSGGKEERRRGGVRNRGRERGREGRREGKKCPSIKYIKLKGCVYLCPAQGYK